MTSRLNMLGVVGGHWSCLVARPDRHGSDVLFYIVEQGDGPSVTLCSSLGLRLRCPSKARAVELAYKVAKWEGVTGHEE